MNKYCPNCERLILEGERVRFSGTATYHLLKSKVYYALDRHDMDIDPDSLCHASCVRED